MSVKDGASTPFSSIETTQLIHHTKTDSFPASAAFDAINAALQSEADRKDAIKQGAGIYAFTLTNSAGNQASWHIDLKNEGKVGKGLGGKPDGEPLNPPQMVQKWDRC
jgi:hypothetical protein